MLTTTQAKNKDNLQGEVQELMTDDRAKPEIELFVAFL